MAASCKAGGETGRRREASEAEFRRVPSLLGARFQGTACCPVLLKGSLLPVLLGGSDTLVSRPIAREEPLGSDYEQWRKDGFSRPDDWGRVREGQGPSR